MTKIRMGAALLLIVGTFLGYAIYASSNIQGSYFNRFPFQLGLDLNGGTHLTYKADVSKVASGDVNSAMQSLRDVIERRVNLFGVTEPTVQVETGGALSGNGIDYRLAVELPGVTDVKQAVELIGKTPSLEFRIATEAYKNATSTDNLKLEDAFTATGLDGKYLQRAVVELDPTTRQPTVGITFNNEGKALFAKITKENIGQVLAIFLDGQPITTPVIRSEITDGKAQISGNFDTKTAQELVRNLNYGALPVPIELLSTQSVGPTLGAKVLNAGIFSGLIAFIVISIFLIIWYRLPGVVAVVALALYTILNLVIFKLVHVTLTAAGIAAFILSIGMAVDANILIFERTKEELKRGKNLDSAIREGFHRAWSSIRDSNSSSIITAVVLYYFASSSVVKGFALVFGIGVVTSMFTAITATRTLLLALNMKDSKISRFLFSSGFLR
jgi:protein-export membrane protein SecD